MSLLVVFLIFFLWTKSKLSSLTIKKKKKMCAITQIAAAIYSRKVVYKAWDYGCFLSVRHFASQLGPHTVCSECDERQWVIDAHGLSTHLLCSSGGSFWGMPSHCVRCWGVERCIWDTMGKLRNSQTFSFHQHYIIPCLLFSRHIKRSWGEACLRIRAVDGLCWAFGCPETWSPSFYACTCGLKINVMIKVKTFLAMAQLFEVNSLLA